MSSQRYRFLRPEDIRQLRNYQFGAQAMVEGWLSGRHRSKDRGASIEFHEYREYAPGDDPADVDWRVFARTDRHYLRLYEQETDMDCHIFVDSSASMGWPEDRGEGPLSKLEYASFFAACLAWLVVSKTDQVSLTLFAEGIRKSFPSGATRKHLHELLVSLEQNEAGGETSLAESLERASSLLKKKGTLVVLSDFYEEPGRLFAALNRYLHRGFRVHLFHVLDVAERELPETGLARFVDVENGERVTLHSEAVRAEVKAAFEKHLSALRSFAASRQVDYALAWTDESYFKLFDRLS
ncbi:MAG: DUF58 domain-containing protein [Verrucomicrobiota bacterium]